MKYRTGIENDSFIKIDDKSLNIDYGYDGEYEMVDELDNELRQDKKSDDSYQKTASKIVQISENQLRKQNETKKGIQNTLLVFFVILLSIQLISIVVLILLKGFCEKFDVSDSILVTFVTSAFVETLGVIAIMVKFAFNVEQETDIISILSSYIKDFKVYNSSEHKTKK